MAPNRADDGKPKFLSSWKEIATYMGKGVRTVQRYESELGLPVRRPGGKPRGSVVATCAEIDAWVAASPIGNEFPLSGAVHRDPELEAIKNGIKEMHLLREQMNALRNETRTSLELLLDGVKALRVLSRRDRAHSDDILEKTMQASEKMFSPGGQLFDLRMSNRRNETKKYS